MARSEKNGSDAVEHRALTYGAGTSEGDFTRADLMIDGVDHAGDSYEVRVFINNKEADGTTQRTQDEGYAGRFYVLGHGGCYGGEGHCDKALAAQIGDAVDPITGRAHPLAPQTFMLTVTDLLKAIIDRGDRVENVTLVPIKKEGKGQKRTVVTPGMLDSNVKVSLRTYR